MKAKNTIGVALLTVVGAASSVQAYGQDTGLSPQDTCMVNLFKTYADSFDPITVSGVERFIEVDDDHAQNIVSQCYPSGRSALSIFNYRSDTSKMQITSDKTPGVVIVVPALG